MRSARRRRSSRPASSAALTASAWSAAVGEPDTQIAYQSGRDLP